MLTAFLLSFFLLSFCFLLGDDDVGVVVPAADARHGTYYLFIHASKACVSPNSNPTASSAVAQYVRVGSVQCIVLYNI